MYMFVCTYLCRDVCMNVSNVSMHLCIYIALAEPKSRREHRGKTICHHHANGPAAFSPRRCQMLA